jgi:hypothetical protein
MIHLRLASEGITRTVAVLVLGGAFALACIAEAQLSDQSTIRVESREVVVPVLVLDKKRADGVRTMGPGLFSLGVTGDGNPLLSDVPVRGLTAADFHIFEDGKEQKIERFALEPDAGLDRTAGVGKWIYIDRPDFGFGIQAPHWVAYLIAYPQPPSARGSCRQISVKVDRPDSLIYARSSYCNLGDSAADPLGGTTRGDRLEAKLNSRKSTSINLSLTAFNSFRSANAAITNIVVGFPQDSMKAFNCDKPPTVDVLGIVEAKDGTLTTRFSDLQNLGMWSFVGQTLPSLTLAGAHCTAYDYDIPYQYETQLDLAPGEYSLRVAFEDGKKFGRAETRIMVPTVDTKQLTISDVALSRRHREASTEAQEAAMLPGAYVPLTSKGFEVTPTADSRFKRGEPFAFYFEIYTPQERGMPASKIEAHLRILDAKTGQVAKDIQPVNAASYAKPADPIIPISGGIDIGKLPSGSYRLEVQATDSAGNATPWRGVDFAIE